jgi:hypothetical protein
MKTFAYVYIYCDECGRASITAEGEKEIYREFSVRNCSRAVAWKIEMGLGA